MTTQTITLGAGCFWCIEDIFNRINGVSSAISGYSGGTVIDPTYQDICTGQSNHAEVVKVTFDHELISFDQILTVFFAIHDPTTLNRQGNDIGTQYRSVIYFQDEQQHQQAKAKIAELTAKNVFANPIVTQLQQEPIFYPAEEYHQRYFTNAVENNTVNQYCQYVVAEKVGKFIKTFPELLKVQF